MCYLLLFHSSNAVFRAKEQRSIVGLLISRFDKHTRSARAIEDLTRAELVFDSIKSLFVLELCIVC